MLLVPWVCKLAYSFPKRFYVIRLEYMLIGPTVGYMALPLSSVDVLTLIEIMVN